MMGINPAAVSSFLKRRLRNSDKAKRFTDEALDRKIQQLDPRPDFAYPPYRHQKICFLLGLKHPGYVFLLSMGLGKSSLVLNLFRYRLRCEQATRALVLVPFSANVGAWIEECAKHAPDLRVVGLGEWTDRRMRQYAIADEELELIIITYSGWNHLVCEKKKKKMVVDRIQAEICESLFDFVIFDESSSLKNHRSLTYQTCLRLSRSSEYRYCLTGTPFNRDPQELWPQFNVTDSGQTLGSTLGMFREAFFNKKKNHFSGWYDYVFDQKKEKKLNRVLRHGSIRFSEKECLDLPPQIGGLEDPMIRPVHLTDEARPYYDGIVEEFHAAHGNYQLMDAAYHRMRMVCSGFLAARDEDGERVEIVFKTNPKMEVLEALLAELGEKKLIIFHTYNTTGRLITEYLKKREIRHGWLYGKTRKKSDVVQNFKTNPHVRILVASKSGAFGLNLQESCHHMAFFETPDDQVTRLQMEKRIRRSGQTKVTYYYDLLVWDTIEYRILRSLQAGKRFFDALVDGEEL